MFLREVGEAQEGGETVVTVTEGVDRVDLLAGTFSTVNAGISAGTLYNSEVPRVNLADAEREEVELGASLGERVLMPDVVLDTVSPKIIGWVEPEVEPNDVFTIYETYGLDPDSLDQAQLLPVPSGPGFVDQVTAVMSFPEADPYWEYGDSDVYAFQVPEEMGARIAISWTDPDINLDLNFHTEAGDWWGAGWDVADANPEGFDSASYLGHTFLPGETWYVSVLGWEGPAGEHDYLLELEWTNP